MAELRYVPQLAGPGGASEASGAQKSSLKEGNALKEAKPKTDAGTQTRATEARGARGRGPGYESRDDGKQNLTELKNELKRN